MTDLSCIEVKLREAATKVYLSKVATSDKKDQEVAFGLFQKQLGIVPEFCDKSYKRWSKDQTFMSMAYIASRGSHDANTQHGAVIVDEKHHIVSTGCNGFLPNSPDDLLPNTREGGHKYKFIRHAEQNACDQATRADLKGCRIYVTGVPCNECMKTLIARGIQEVVIGDVSHVMGDGFWEMHHYLTQVHGVTVRKYLGNVIDTSQTRKIT
jgi:dCMP deaminase